MADMQVWELAMFIILFFWLLLAHWHYSIVPGLDKGKCHEIILFIAEYKGITLDPKKIIPGINIINIEQLALPNSAWSSYGGVVDFAIENYYPKHARVNLIEECRQNILVHVLTHYIQYEYENRTLEYLGSYTADKDAWAVTRAYLKKFYPYRYWILTIPFGIYQWWTSTPY